MLKFFWCKRYFIDGFYVLDNANSLYRCKTLVSLRIHSSYFWGNDLIAVGFPFIVKVLKGPDEMQLGESTLYSTRLLFEIDIDCQRTSLNTVKCFVTSTTILDFSQAIQIYISTHRSLQYRLCNNKALQYTAS